MVPEQVAEDERRATSKGSIVGCIADPRIGYVVGMERDAIRSLSEASGVGETVERVRIEHRHAGRELQSGFARWEHLRLARACRAAVDRCRLAASRPQGQRICRSDYWRRVRWENAGQEARR